ncbi:hypothetical protein [Halohasta salina]|uniref:hypothetical protein n=1 Tax=Halohasta salina TaxID=2961621 RepID=UPI0020A5DDDA|nr:hypothetical protein [Halohasta salina]
MVRIPGHTSILLVMVAVMILMATAPGVVAQSSYQLSTPDSVDTPTREITLRSTTYEVSALGRAEPDSSVDLTVDAPDNQFYRVYLYNSSQTPVIRESGTGDSKLTFDLSGQDPGTYMFALQEQGTTQVIHPLVIKGYGVDLDTPDQVSSGDSFTADISLSQTGSDLTADRVEVVVAGQESQITETASENGDSYTATVSTDPLSDGSYSVYANVRGTNTVYNEQEILGVSSTNEVIVGDNENTDGDETTDNENTDGDETTDNETPNDTNEPSGQIKDPEATEELPDPEPDEGDQTDTSSEDDQGQTDTQSETSSTIPGFTFPLAVIAVMLTSLTMRFYDR